jgi:hypothetical protein
MGLISACLATIGLVTNSQTTLLGSMLMSPIGSLITKNIIYNFLIKNNHKLDIKYKKWLMQIVIVLIVTLLISYLLGILFQKIKNPFTKEDLTENLPTSEMIDRANPNNIIYMIFISIFCGFALSIALVIDKGIKLVAIGIATALIPPIANIGLSLSLKEKNDEIKDYKKNSITTGISIFIINAIFLWLPSKFMLPYLIKKNNIFRFIENIFIFPKILFKIKKYKEYTKIDKDSDGFINMKEYINYYSKGKVKKSILKKKFKKLDKNNSGKINMRDEFLNIK